MNRALLEDGFLGNAKAEATQEKPTQSAEVG